MKYSIVKDKNGKKDLNNKNDVAEKPKWTLDEIALPSSTIEQIDQIVAYFQNRDKLLHEWEYSKFLKLGSGLAVNFYGLPGTGKSITAEAVAHRLGLGIIKINYGDLESEYVGGTSKNLAEVFESAKKTQSLLFFDEADTILSKRIAKLSHAADHGVNSTKGTLLTLLNKFDGVIIFATNRFDIYDPAFLRRILFHIEFSMPDALMRDSLWRLHLSQKVPKNFTYEQAVDLSDGLCGGDIRNISIKLALKLLVGNKSALEESDLSLEIENYKINNEKDEKSIEFELPRNDD